MNAEFFFKVDEKMNFMIFVIEYFFIILFSFYTFFKFINIEKMELKNKFIIIISSLIISFCGHKFIEISNIYYYYVMSILLISMLNLLIFKKDTLYTITVTILSFVINEAMYFLAEMIAFIPNAILKISNDYIAATTIIIVYAILMFKIFKIRKIKNGISFLQRKLQNSYINILLVNISLMALFLKAILPYTNIGEQTAAIGINSVVFFIALIFFIKQSFDMVYKHNLMEKDLSETKAELESTKKELVQANKDNLEISEKMHTLNHRQKSLQHQIEKLTKSNKDIKYLEEQLDSISEEMYQEPEEIELIKTDIPAVDTMLEYMQSECKENNIKFELQVLDNIHYMVNNYISENDLEILIADHIKDAIIAINHSENTNRSILVRLGKIDGFYGLYIYDTGIEFTKEVLEKLGKAPITTHKDDGGTGMGFMNTFNTLNKTNASLVIKEIGEPCVDNYTKIVIIKFDNKNEFKVESYKKELEYSN